MAEALPVKRIALLTPRDTVLVAGPQGGSSILLLEDRSLLQQAGWDVRVFGPIAKHGVPVETIPVYKVVRRLASLEYCGRFVKGNPATVLLAYNEPTVAMFAPSRTIIRFDWQTPLPRYWPMTVASRRFRRATYLFPSDALRSLWCSEHPGVPIERTRVIHNGVDLHLFRPARRDRNRCRIGFAGQWISDKGLHILISAWEEVRKAIPEAELWIAGGPDLWQGTHPVPEEKLVAVNKLRAKIDGLELVGVLPRERMPGFWSQVDLACFPSVWEEPFGLSALEAMACGVPVVVSDSGALPEVVGDAGVVVPRSDERALAQVLISLLLSSGTLERLGAQARSRACMFDLKRRGAELEHLIEEVARGV